MLDAPMSASNDDARARTRPSAPPPPRLYEEVLTRLTEARRVLDDASSGHFLDLVQAMGARDAEFALYTGAGVTLSAEGPDFKPPTWRGLLENLFFYKPSPSKLKEWSLRAGLERPALRLDELYGRFDRLQLAWMITTLCGGVKDRNAAIARMLHNPHGLPPSALIAQLVRLPWSLIVTTNYDTIFEQHLDRHIVEAAKRKPQDSEPPESYRPAAKMHVVRDSKTLEQHIASVGLKYVYLHGGMDRDGNVASDFVLDRFDYARLISERDGLLDFVTQRLRVLPVVFVGSSLDDPSFNLIEQRLFAFRDPSRWPPCYAFVQDADEVEVKAWKDRGLSLIVYRDASNKHQRLTELVQTIADARSFLCWAAPDELATRDRVDTAEADRNLAKALDAYSLGDYANAMKAARAALASTLLWDPASLKPNSAFSERWFERNRCLVQVRRTLGLSHYHARYADRDQQDRVEWNIAPAQGVLARVKPDIDDDLRASSDEKRSRHSQLQTLESSISSLEARYLYPKGDWDRAAEIYDTVIATHEARARAILAEEDRVPTDEEATLLEAWAHSYCQRSRIAYQQRDGTGKEWDGKTLLTLSQGLAKLAARVQREPSRGRSAKSLRNIANIARWFAGRAWTGVVRDVVPTEDERESAGVKDALDLAIDALSQPADGGSVGWRALAARYRGRAYALRLHLNLVKSDRVELIKDDYHAAFAAMTEAAELTRQPGLAREYVLGHLENARVQTIVTYASLFRMLSWSRALADAVHPIALTDALHHLAVGWKAREELAAWPSEQAFVEATAIRVGGYLAQACKHLRLGMPPDLVRSMPGADGNIERAVQGVAERYARIRAAELEQRISVFDAHLRKARGELQL